MFNKTVCWLVGHKWSMTRGFRGAAHHTAHCRRCDIRAIDIYPDLRLK